MFCCCEGFCPGNGRLMWMFCSRGGILSWFSGCFRDVLLPREILSWKWVRNEDVLCRGCVSFGKGVNFL